jgi:hypothetical protein|tara:strand:- start:530 stop:1411 length:882 start_codon:yes stop_codon:yes gene_type:complete
MSDMTLFEGNSLVSSDLFKKLQETDDNLTGGSGGIKSHRISLRGGRFRELVNGEQVNVKSDGFLNVVVINAAKLSRTYYKGAYDAENPSAPTCWSPDTQTPSSDVPKDQMQASRCMDCPQNIKGSGQGESRACRFSQRLAILLEGQMDTVYQLQLPATSIFGEARDGNMGMQAYAKYLKAHKTPSIAVVTQMSFDENSDTPKLFFKAVRPLNEDELNQAVAMKDSEDAIKAITLTVSQTDGVQAKRDGAVQEDEVDIREPVPAPKKVAKKKEVAAPSDEEADLASIVDDWDDD